MPSPMRSESPNFTECTTLLQGRVVQKVDNAIRQINYYQGDTVVCFVNTHSLDSKLSGG